MKLLTTRRHPPGGFPYYCPKCGWVLPTPLSTWTENVKTILKHRRNNPGHGMSLSVDSIELEYAEQVCAGLRNDTKWCRGVAGQQAAGSDASKKSTKACVGCGRKKKRTG